MKRIFQSALFIFAVSLLLIACGKKSTTRPVAESVSSFLNGNTNIISFGAFNLNDVLNKTGYQDEPKIKILVNETFSQLQSSVNLETPVFYAVEGPLKDNNPAATYLFLEVKNSDSLKTNLVKNGFEVTDNKEFQYVSDGDMCLAFDKNIVTVIIKSGITDEKALLTAVRKRLTGDVSTGYVADILNQKNDFTFGVNLANLYSTSNTDLANLSAEKQKELTDMMANSFISGALNFNNGEMAFKVKNHFSDALKNKLFFLKDSNAKIVSNLGAGAPKAGLSLNLDTKKLQEFLNEYAPNAMDDLTEEIGGPFALAMLAADGDISKLIDGRIGALVFGDANNLMSGLTPDLNFFIGLAGQGKKFGETIKEQLADKFKKVELTNAGIAGSSSLDFVGNSVQLPASAANFGKNSVDFFLDLSTVDAASFDLDGGMKFLELLKSVSFTYNSDGGEIIIKTKDNKDNILKQVLQKALQSFEDQLAF